MTTADGKEGDGFRNRIVETRLMKASELTDNAGNWRTHPDAQREAMTGVLEEIGVADSLTAYYSERNGGLLTLIDGHLRRSIDPDQAWTVNITDLTDAESDMLILLLDPLAAMAGTDRNKAQRLLEEVNADTLAVREMLRQMELSINQVTEEAEGAQAAARELDGPPAMELLPFEHYDYVLLMFRHELDWLAAIETLVLERRSDQRKTKKIGLARVIDGARVINMIRELQGAGAQGVRRGE